MGLERKYSKEPFIFIANNNTTGLGIHTRIKRHIGLRRTIDSPFYLENEELLQHLIDYFEVSTKLDDFWVSYHEDCLLI